MSDVKPEKRQKSSKRSLLVWSAATLLGAVLVHVLLVYSVPYLVMGHLQLQTKLEANEMHHFPQPTSDSRSVVRPSPDLLYSACPFDLSAGPLRVTARVPEGYFSLAAFADNTDNFFVLSPLRQQQAGASLGDNVVLVLLREGQDYAPREGEQVLQSPSTQGLVLLRYLVEEPSRLSELSALQHEASCSTLH